jgi:hypothetical protein
LEATPLESPRKKLRIPLPAGELSEACLGCAPQLNISFTVSDVEVERIRFRVLDAQSKTWPGKLLPGADSLFLGPLGGREEAGAGIKTDSAGLPVQPTALARSGLERALFILPRENEEEYRAFAGLKALGEGTVWQTALFLGDPLVEQGAAVHQANLAARIAKAWPAFKWSNIFTAGPHRYEPIFRMLAGLDEFVRAQPEGRFPELVVLSLGGGDVARQTQLHDFERALSLLLRRLRLAGAEKIFIIGVLPEPEREKQCQSYQERVLGVQRQQHVEGLDLFNTWTIEKDWARRYSLEGMAGAPIYGAELNAQALDEIVNRLQQEL